jgi:hypothetical protein
LHGGYIRVVRSFRVSAPVLPPCCISLRLNVLCLDVF